ncbi:MAG: tetratricopeptide repeat protein [Candidatus Heimdallarchaeota archaeon]|nr:tetratricopeptide repeat protein [Candidatus Heimdallarchaeota archaeon]
MDYDQCFTFVAEGQVQRFKEILNFIAENSKDELNWLILKAYILEETGEFSELFHLSNKFIELSKELDDEFYLIKSLMFKGHAQIRLNYFDDGFESLKQAESMIINYKGVNKGSVFERTKAHVYYGYGLYHWRKQNNESAIEYYQIAMDLYKDQNVPRLVSRMYNNCGLSFHQLGKISDAWSSLAKSEEINKMIGYEYGQSMNCINISTIFQHLGEYSLALEKLDEAYELIQKFPLYRSSYYRLGFYYRNKGLINYYIGNNEKAIDNLKLALESFEKADHIFDNPLINFYLLKIYTEKNNLKKAEQYLERLFIYHKLSLLDKYADFYEVSKGILLIAKNRLKSLAEAENIFLSLNKNIDTPFDEIQYSMLYLCDIYVREIKLTGNITALSDLKETLNKLNQFAEERKIFHLQIETMLIQTRILILEFEFTQADELLDDAITFAQEKGLIQLTLKIIEEQSILREMSKNNTLLSIDKDINSRLKSVEFDMLFEKFIQGRQRVNYIIHELPVTFIVITISGTVKFTIRFEEQSLLREELIGNFLSAINLFGQEVFANKNNIAEIVHGNYNIVIKNEGELLFCYIYRGTSIESKPRMVKIVDTIRQNNEVWENLTENYHISVNMTNYPYLEQEIKALFPIKNLEITN